MVFRKAKQQIVELKTQLCACSKLLSTNAMHLINATWKVSFANKNANSNAIAKRTQYPFNRILLQNPEIRATMTPSDTPSKKIQLWYAND